MGKRSERRVDTSPPEETIGRGQAHPLVGREQEIAYLQQALLEAERYKQGQRITEDLPEPDSWVMPARTPFYLLYGEMGIGKTRLAEETARQAYQRGWSILWGRAYTQERAPYQLWTEILRQATKHDSWSQVETHITAALIQPLVTLLPELSYLLPQQALPDAFPITHPEQLWEAILIVLLAMSRRNPVLIVLDDLQWADSSSSEFLAYLCRHLVDLPFLLLGTCRNSKLPVEYTFSTQLLQLQRERLVTSLQLAPLSDAQIATFVTGAPEHIVKHVQYLAAGNPFFAEELVRAVRSKNEQELREPITQQWTLPQTISDLFEQRLERLSKGCLQTLRAAAVLGVSFSLSTIALMQAKGGSMPDKEGTQVLLEEAQQAELLTEQGGDENLTYHFWHPLLLHHLYESTSAARRTLLHRRAGQVLQELYRPREDEGAPLIVHHLIQSSGDATQIAHYAELAGRRAYMLSAYADAEKYYRQAIHYLTEHLQKRLQIASTEQLHIATLQEYLAECLRVLNRPEEACEAYEQMRAIYNQQRSLPSDDLRHVQLQALLLFHIARTWYARGDMERTLLYCSQAEDMLEAAGITDGAAWAYTFLQESYAYWRKGLHQQAHKLAQRACSLFEAILQQQDVHGDPLEKVSPIKRMLVGDVVGLAHAYYHLAAITNSMGQYQEALVLLYKALAIYEQQGCRRNVAIVCNDIGDIYLRLTDFPQAQAFFERGLQDARYVGDTLLVSYIVGNSGILAMRRGQLSKAEEHFRLAIAQVEQCNELIGKILFSPYLALLLAEQGKLSQARETLYIALTLARRLHLVPYIGYVLIMLGNIRVIEALIATASEAPQEHHAHQVGTQLLRRARRTLERALTFEGLDAEIYLMGTLTLLEICWLLDRNELLYEQVLTLQMQAEQSGLKWLLPGIERLLGLIRSAEGTQQATQHFERSLHQARHYDLRWEYGRTLHIYGSSLVRQRTHAGYMRGIPYLQEARLVFSSCQATRDLQTVEKLLEACADARQPEVTPPQITPAWQI